MLDSIKGKKLLILGATVSETTLVKRAQELGAYVIVTDYNTDYSLSPAKYVADECWDISWSDIDTLERLCREKGIQGVTAGYSEFRVENMIKLCERLHLPSYISMEQLEITRDKEKFKKCCINNGVPTVKSYSSLDEVDAYPVIIKPVDRAGSIGISIASNRDELEKACKYAMECSVKKQIIIEKYIEKGTKIDFYYAIDNGNILLITTCDTINANENGLERVVQSAWLYPSRVNSESINHVDGYLRNMINNMEIKYGCIFFSGFVCDDGNIVFFECGFRLEGGHQYNYTKQKGPFNYLDLFILHALKGNTEGLLYSSVNKDLKAATINLYAKEGTISSISGFDKVSHFEDCCLALQHCRMGEKCDINHAILQKIGMFQFVNTSSVHIKNDVDRMYEVFMVNDENGNDMIYDRIDTRLIDQWWSLQQETDIVIKEKDRSISYDSIQNLLNIAHEENKKQGLLYATANQSVDKLIAKIGDGVCFIALDNENDNLTLVGTCTLEKRNLNYWYVNSVDEPLLLLKLVGVHPGWKKKGVGKKLIDSCIDYAYRNHYKMIVTDSAEENHAFRKLVNNCGFKAVDCVKYAGNNFVSTVYAKWIDCLCPWEDSTCKERYDEHRKNIKEKQ